MFAAASGANLRAVANNKGVKINATQIERTGVGEEAQCSQRDVYERVRARKLPALILYRVNARSRMSCWYLPTPIRNNFYC